MRSRSRLRTLLLAFAAFLLFSGFTFTSPAQAAKADDVYMKKTGKEAYLYYTATGKKVTGITGIKELPKGSKHFYYFRNNKGRIYANTWIRLSGATYSAKKDGTLRLGWYKPSAKKHYFFNRYNAKMVKGWQKYNGKYYYLDAKTGVMKKGWLKLNGKTYYLNPSDGTRVTGQVKIDGKCYCFNNKGVMQTGLVKVGGKTYYYSAAGNRKYGLVTVNGNKYYFNKKNGAMETGWKTISGKKYYFSASGTNPGAAVVGWAKLSGKSYYFNGSGVMQKGWLTIGTKKYYLDPTTGAMTTGKKKIDGKTYDFGTKGYIEVQLTGAWHIKVNKGTQVVTVYRGTTPVKAMRCSSGATRDLTPEGTFSLRDKLRWHELNGPVWGQYCSHLTGSILFHSVYYLSYCNPYTLDNYEYDCLGTPRSHGCIRLACGDAYWLYVNCPIGTQVTIFYGSSNDDPLGKPALVPRTKAGVDPTDPVYK